MFGFVLSITGTALIIDFTLSNDNSAAELTTRPKHMEQYYAVFFPLLWVCSLMAVIFRRCVPMARCGPCRGECGRQQRRRQRQQRTRLVTLRAPMAVPPRGADPGAEDTMSRSASPAPCLTCLLPADTRRWPCPWAFSSPL